MLIIIALLFIDNNKLTILQKLSFIKCLLYDVDLMYMLTYLQPKQQYLLNLTSVSFKGTKFWSNSVTQTMGDVPKLDFSLIFNLTNMNSLNFSYSNVLQIISDTHLQSFCQRLKELKNFKYLGLAGVISEYINVRKYRLLLENLPVCEKLNISFNIVLPSPIIEVGLF